MAYVAVISVMNTIQRLFHSTISIASSSFETLESARNELESVKQVLKRLDSCSSSKRERMYALDGPIREAVYKLEDAIESQLSNCFHPQFESYLDTPFSIYDELIHSLVDTLKKMKEEYVRELDTPLLPEEGNFSVSARSIGLDGKKSSVFGLSDDEITRLKHELTKRKLYELRVVAVVVKEDISRKVFGLIVCKEASLSESFKRHAIAEIGHDYRLKDILLCILSQIDLHFDEGECHKLLTSEGDDKCEKVLGERVYSCLKGGRYLIVLDGVWDIEVWNLLQISFPEEDNGSRIFLTTRLMEVAKSVDSHAIYPLNILIEDESWGLICQLDPSSCPSQHAEKVPLIQRFICETYNGSSQVEDEEEDDEDEISGDNDEIISKDIKEDLQLDRSSDDDGDGEGDEFSPKSANTIKRMYNLFQSVDQIMFVEAHPSIDEPPNIISLFGMAGIGKTVIAREIIVDPSIVHRFEHRVWITLGPNYQSENILADILTQLDPEIDKMHLMKGDELLAEHFWTKASCKRCLILLDDVWSEDPLRYLKKLFYYIKFEVLLTTRLKKVVSFANPSNDPEISKLYEMRLLNKEESWRMLRENVFGEKLCLPELENVGKIIAENCEGLPLMIVMVASLLCEAEETLECWTEVAKKENKVFEQAYDKISDMLYPSYECLPQFLKPCFLYMAVFPKKYEIPTSKLFKLWNSEGIIELNSLRTFEKVAMEYVEELVSRSLLLEGKKSSRFRTKTSRLHSVYWHLCVREARKNKFLHVLSRQLDGFSECIEGQRRLCVQNNTLFAIKDVHDSIASIPSIRSLLCTGTPHQYQVPVLFDGLLRILDALTIRFYELPIKVLHLVNLQYFGLTYDGKLPPSISQLSNLECLIVRRHLHTKLSGAPLYLPKEIWDMKELKHLQVMGSDLPDPCGAVLPKLVTLLEVSSHSVIKGILQGTPNLKKLGIRIELRPDLSEPMFSFDYLCHLEKLESLKCAVVNPELITSGIVPSPPPMLSLPQTVRKLSLSGLGYSWQDMTAIAWLPNLKVLKLRCYAFQGPEWAIKEGQLEKLQYLLIEDTDLECMETHNGFFSDLRRLIFRHCYKLRKFYGVSLSTCLVELVDCCFSASKYAKSMEPWMDANVHSSWQK